MTEHRRCGGNLLPEEHDRWSTAQSGSHLPFKAGTEILYRCDRCHLVGVLCEVVPAPGLEAEPGLWADRGT